MARRPKLSKGKVMKPTFFVFCEGKTEAAYVDLLRRNFRVPVEIIVRISDSNISLRFVDTCKREKFTAPQDKTFLMFDLDVPGMLERLLKIKDATLLLSNPSIEFWFLLHYVDHNAQITSADVLRRLIQIDGNYAKGPFSTKMRNQLLAAVDDAIDRAKRKPAYDCPSTTVFRLIEAIRS